jgi:putative DNA primase/helicase
MTAGEEERLRSWIAEIIEALIEGVRWRQEGDEKRALNQGGLTINVRSGCWYNHSTGEGGWSALSLIEFLNRDGRAEAESWAAAWLNNHPGRGSCATADDDIEIEHAIAARDILYRLIEPAGTPAETYLRSRGISGELPSSVRYLPDARIGEGAVAGILTSHDRVVGVQLGYLDPDGRKSTVAPSRRRFMLERASDAVFELATQSGVTDMLADTVVVEGLEDALSISELGRPWRIVGLPGIGALKHLSVKRNERVIVVRDGDAPGSSADTALVAAIDHLLLEGAAVKVTPTPLGADANSVLQNGGVKALNDLIGQAKFAHLSIIGEIERLARLDPLDYDGERKSVAERFDLRLKTLDHEVGKRRAPATQSPGNGLELDVDELELLDEPVDLAETLEEAFRELRRYIVAKETELAALILWAAHTHLCHHPHLRIQRSPRLAIQARTPGSGKTTVLEAVGTLVPRPRVASSLTASTVLRVVSQVRPTLLIDEADHVLRDMNSDLLAILNAGDRRPTAWVERSVPTPNGDWKVHRFPVWSAVAFAGIDELPPTQQDRSIVIQMQKALDCDVPDHLEDGSSPELRLLRRKLGTWAHGLEELPRPNMPEILRRQAGRSGDNWRILIAIGDLAGGRWPDLIRKAAIEAVRREGRLTVVQRLLESLWRIFAKRATDSAVKEEDRDRIATPELIAALLADDEEEWGTANHGRAVTSYWLRDNLRHLLDPPGAQQWEAPAIRAQRGKRYRGYVKSQFEHAWERHIPERSPEDVSETCGVSGVSGGDEQYQGDNSSQALGKASLIRGNAPEKATPDVENYPGSPGGPNPRNSAVPPDTPDTPDASEGPGAEEEPPASDARRNGERSLSQIDRDIITFAETNPNRTIASIARHFGQPKVVVAELLGRNE